MKFFRDKIDTEVGTSKGKESRGGNRWTRETWSRNWLRFRCRGAAEPIKGNTVTKVPVKRY